MVQAVQVIKWKSFDGVAHDTRAIAEKHEVDNFHLILGAATAEHFHAAAQDDHSGTVAEAVLRAAALIRKRRRTVGMPDAQPPVDP